MPAQPQWLTRIPQILECLRAMRPPVLGRQAIEEIFQLKRRQAIHLMHRFGGFQLGRTFAIDRLRLIDELERLRAEPDYWWETARRKRFSQVLTQMRAHSRAAKVTLPVAMPHHGETPPPLPAGVDVRPGELRVQFHSAVDLLGKLYEVAQRAAADLEGFEQLLAQSEQWPE